MQRELTAALIDSLEPKAKQYEIADTKTGVRIIVFPSGKGSWVLRYWLNGAQRKYTIGPCPLIGLKDARQRALKAKVLIADGVDPNGERQAMRAAARAKVIAEAPPLDLVKDVVEGYIRQAKRETRPRSWREVERNLSHDVIPRWGTKRLSEITKADAHRLLDSFTDRGKKVMARRTLAVLKAMGGWALSRDLITTNIFTTIRLPGKASSRERVLNDTEIAALLAVASDTPYPAGPLVRLLLMLGVRRTELSELKWSEFDLDAREWRLPGARAKNGKELLLPLPDDAIAILKALPRIPPGDLVFTFDGKSGVRAFSDIKRRLDAAMAVKLGKTVPHWVLHDARRTLATNFQRLGVRLEVTEATLNHVSGSRAGIVGVYQRHDWAAEKRQALEAWARRLREIATGAEESNVVTMAVAGRR